jgi:hypothetical protein
MAPHMRTVRMILPSFLGGNNPDGLTCEDGISSETARRLADLLVTAADEIDGWTEMTTTERAKLPAIPCTPVQLRAPFGRN